MSPEAQMWEPPGGWPTDEEVEAACNPKKCGNCGKKLATAKGAHWFAGLAVCCPDCICTGKCGCP